MIVSLCETLLERIGHSSSAIATLLSLEPIQLPWLTHRLPCGISTEADKQTHLSVQSQYSKCQGCRCAPRTFCHSCMADSLLPRLRLADWAIHSDNPAIQDTRLIFAHPIWLWHIFHPPTIPQSTHLFNQLFLIFLNSPLDSTDTVV